MAIFGQYQGGDSFNVAGNMRDVLKGQQGIHDSMLQAVEKFNTARQDMEVLQKQTGAILSQYGVDEKGKPDDTAPKYVHDLYKAVNNEGGVANMSRSQMIAGIKAYETGFGVEAKQVELQAAREGVRAKQNANNIAELQYKEALKAREEQARIKAAYQATEELRKGLSKTKTGEGKERFAIKVGKEDIEVDTKEITPLLDAVATAEKIADPKEREKAIKDANMAVEKYLYSKSRISREFDETPDGVSTETFNEATGEWEYKEGTKQTKNPLYKPFQSAFEDSAKTEFNLTKGERPADPTIARGTTTAYIRTELAKQKAIRDLTEEKKDIDIDTAKFNLGQSPVGTSGKSQYNDTILRGLQADMNRLDIAISANESIVKGERQGYSSPLSGDYVEYTPSNNDKLEARIKVQGLQEKRKAFEEKFNARKSQLEAKLKSFEKPVTEYKAGAVTISPEGFREEYRNTQVQMVKSMEEQTDDEYAIMTSFFKSNGGIPDSFTKEAFYKMKGINSPISIPLGGGNRYVEVNGEKKFVTDVQSQGMSIADEERMWKAGEFAKARNLNGVTANGFRFSGEVRVGDIDRANKVKEELFTSTRALASVDRMLEIAENASLFDKLLPTEISGIAQSLTNAAQSANRTEIGGSGAWSNQDQIYMDKVIRDPSSGFNAIFSTQAIASLREYRSRLLAGMVDKGTAYGFAFERGGNQEGLDSSMSQFRVRFNSALARNMTEQEALEYAKGTLYANGSE
jgi:hypothetical protein